MSRSGQVLAIFALELISQEALLNRQRKTCENHSNLLWNDPMGRSGQVLAIFALELISLAGKQFYIANSKHVKIIKTNLKRPHVSLRAGFGNFRIELN